MKHDTIINQIQAFSPEQEATKNLVIAKMEQLEAIRFRRRNEKERLEMAMMQDEEYKKLMSTSKQDKLKLKVAKERLLNNPEIYEMKDNIKEMNREYNEVKQDISDYLVTFEQSTGQLSFMHPEGDKVEIIRMAKPKIIKVKK